MGKVTVAMMDKNYEPKKIEDKWYQAWTRAGAFHNESGRGGEPYCVVIPPPNVTGILHIGHALNNTIQDVLIRWRRMQGRNVVWMPGTDHAGIATQNVVERMLKKEGKSRHDLGRDAFVERVWKWKGEYGSTIINQLKRLGCSCDWERERFTMDEGLSEAVTDVFVRLYNKGLIHRANYIINWCPRCHTALSDEESEHHEKKGKLWYIKYPVRASNASSGVPNEFIVVATTRPETLLGDVAVAVNPKDERYRTLDQRRVFLPILDRELKVIRDDFVDPKFGTGVVKVTPAHDPNDFAMAQRHGLEPVNVMNGDGTMNEAAGPYKGMDRFACRKKILEDLEAQGLIEKTEDHTNAVGHCYRCDTVVEPRLSLQWFVKMKPLAAPAIQAVKDGRIVFVPDRWTKVYLDWMENIRDWCISRQIWWGHRIPVFYCNECGHEWAAKGRPTECPKCGSSSLRQDEDVLDTWFSSWLWPFSTFGWPQTNADLKFYYPTHDLVTASEIIFFWVARMIMAGYEFMGDIPFRTVYIHGTVRDAQGRKMSKSLGNSIDPIEIIEKYNADALRFSLMMITATGTDVYLSNEKFEIGRNFGTKIWNAARFMQMQRDKVAGAPSPAGADAVPSFDPALLSPDDRHILSRLQTATVQTAQHLEKYRFNEVAHTLYEFMWHEYCDWYIEYSKMALADPNPVRQKQVLRLMDYVFANALKLLHPLMPFLTEELWHAMGYAERGPADAKTGTENFILLAKWPEPLPEPTLAGWGVNADAVQYVEDKHELIRLGRTLRWDYGIQPGVEVDYILKPHAAETAARLKAEDDLLRSFLKARSLSVDMNYQPDKVVPGSVGRLGTVYMPLKGLVDAAAETKRLQAQLAKVNENLVRVAAKLNNADFAGRAPAEVVEQQRAKQKELMELVDKLKRQIETLASL